MLEARDAMGGTWDLFRYPGVRSDSDMFTLGYQFKPWPRTSRSPTATTILGYIHETAAEFGIEQHIRYRTKVVGADWSTERRPLDARGSRPRTVRRTMTCGFLYACAGYFDYDRGHTPEFPGIEDFAGEVVHPQFWPEDLAYDDKRVVVIGSGATAVTLVPAMAERAAHVTMLQRSPTWIGAIPGRDKLADTPAREAAAAARPPGHPDARTSCSRWASTTSASASPTAPASCCRADTRSSLGTPTMVAEHFTPTYDPWDQRFCAVPDADLFRSIRHGDAEVVTDHIDAFVPEGIRLRSGRVLEADVVVTATGLKLLPFGGIAPSVDGEAVDLHEQFVWQGAMLTGLPNFAVCIGYTNASWTLRADLTHRLVCRVLNHLDRHDFAAAVPLPRGELEERPLLDLSSGYIQRAIDAVPAPGRPRPVAGAAELPARLADHDAPRPARVDGVHPAVRRTQLPTSQRE